jgi:uncharacterized membrane protein
MNPDEKPNKQTYEQWHKDPKNWKFGLFYYNKRDKRIFPPKRTKFLGWTVNFANPTSIIALIAIAAGIIIIALLLENYLN